MNRFAQLLLLAVASFGPGCSCGGPGQQAPVGTDLPEECSDQDGDEHGVGNGCLGPDCDDSNPEVYDDADCEALCGEDPHSTGCECDHTANPEPEICYTGDQTLLGVGPCRSGIRRCTLEDHWTECENQVLPGDEVCDTIDNDCDGEVDEGVTNECGTCAAECFRDCVGADCGGFDIAEEGENVEECEGDPDCITLGSHAISLHVIWIANTAEGTVSRVDTRTREEEGRYITSSYGQNYQASPSRTSVDFRGDVVVGNRAFGYTASATKIASEDCPAGDTSSGPDDVLDWGDDACVIWNTEFDNNALARAVAVQDRAGLDGAADEVVWIGLYNLRRYYELDRTDGEPTGEEADCSPCTPYGAAIDRDGRLWSACLSQSVCNFDTEDTDDVEVINMPGYNYGITVDEDGRVWTGSTCAVYDPSEEEWQVVAGCSGSGVAADGEGSVWVGSSYCGGVSGTCRIDTETLEINGVAAQSYGVGVDFDGYIWGVPYYQTFVDIIDPGDGPGEEEVERVELGLNGPYTYSDMTGYQLRIATDPQGRYRHVFEGCDTDTTVWTALLYDALTPVGTSISMDVRMADTLAALPAQAWISLGSTATLDSPVDLVEFLPDPPHGKYLEVQFTLFTDSADARPMLRSFEMQWFCDIPIS